MATKRTFTCKFNIPSLYRTELLSLIYGKYGQLALRLTPSYKNGTFLSSSHAKVLAIKLSIIAAKKEFILQKASRLS